MWWKGVMKAGRDITFLSFCFIDNCNYQLSIQEKMSEESFQDLNQLYRVISEALNSLQRMVFSVQEGQQPEINSSEGDQHRKKIFENLKKSSRNLYQYTKFMIIYGQDWKNQAQNLKIQKLSLKKQLSSTITKLMHLQEQYTLLEMKISQKEREIQQIHALKKIDASSIDSIYLKKSASFTFQFPDQNNKNAVNYCESYRSESNHGESYGYNWGKNSEQLIKMPELKNLPTTDALSFSSASQKICRDCKYEYFSDLDVNSPTLVHHIKNMR